MFRPILRVFIACLLRADDHFLPRMAIGGGHQVPGSPTPPHIYRLPLLWRVFRPFAYCAKDKQ